MSRYAALRATFSPYPARRRARRVYFAANDAALTAYPRLQGHDGMTPSGRARILSNLAALEQTMSDAVAAAWPSPESNDDATDLQASSDLLQLLASTEAAEGREFRQQGPDDWEAGFGWALDDLAETNEPARRAELMVRLYLSVHLLLGGDVAETVAVISHAYIDLALAKQQRALDDAREELSMGREER